MSIIYEATLNKNIIKKITTTEIEINLDDLQFEIDELNERIETTPDMMEMPSNKEMLIMERDEKVKNLEELKKVK